ncbi:MAG: molybdopterin-dependent oxidoreductase [bacterium]|nr:molybdopterin-dependent oxidoreductase [bacterium]
MSKNEIIYKSACRMCHGGCGALVHVENGRVTKIKPDPDSPISRGKMCIKGLSSMEHLYNPDRLKYPLKRTGKRGEGKWERISWDEALDTISTRLSEITDKFGRESIVIAQGTGRHHIHHVMRFANALGTPNWMEPGCAQCFIPRVKTGKITYGCLPTPDYYGDVKPECILVWGHNPHICNADGESQFRVRETIRKGAKLIVIDPRKTKLAQQAEIWLQVRPGSDDALALGMIHTIINEDLYDHDFVKKWTHGFNELKERVKDYTPEWAEKITWVKGEKIRQAARLFAKTKPATLEWGVALEQTPNCFQTVRAVSLIPGLTGNFDIPGGWIQGMEMMPDPQQLREELSDEMQKKRLGADRFLYLSGKGEMEAAHVPSVIKAIKTGDPYPVRAMMLCGNNGLLGFANAKETHEAMMSLDFISCQELYMTPTAELADIILPVATWLEMDQVYSVPSLADHVILTTQKIVQMWECRPDEEIFIELAKRMGLNYQAENVKDILNHQLSKAGEKYPKLKGLNFDELKQKGFATTEINYRKYEKGGFGTNTGKMELYSTDMEKNGYDPLPDYSESPETPLSDPETAKEFPLILTTGGRVQEFFHSEFRQLPSLRKRHPDPITELNPETAAEYGIKDGEWIYIETKRGKIQQKARLTEGIDRRVINCQHGWWFPEDKSPEHGVWKSNVNVLTNNKPPYDPVVGTYQLRGLLCRICPVGE